MNKDKTERLIIKSMMVKMSLNRNQKRKSYAREKVNSKEIQKNMVISYKNLNLQKNHLSEMEW